MPADHIKYMDDGAWHLVSADALAEAIGESPFIVNEWCQFRFVTATQVAGQWYLPRAEYDRIVASRNTQ